MKVSIFLTIGILALAAVWGVRSERHHADLLANYERLAAEAQALGIDPEAASAPRTRSRPRSGAPGSGGESPRDAREVAAELVSIIARWAEMVAEGGRHPAPLGIRAEILGLVGDVAGFDDLELGILLDELKDLKNVPRAEVGPARQVMILFLNLLGADQPAAALTVASLLDDMAGPEPRNDTIRPPILSNWASADPAAALEWLRDHHLVQGREPTHPALWNIVCGVARSDLRLAFTLADDLGLDYDDDFQVDSLIRGVIRDPRDRPEFFAILHERMTEEGASERNTKMWRQALVSLGSLVGREDFDSVSALLESVGLRPDERVSFVGSMTHHVQRPDSGRWLEWGAAAATDEAQLAAVSSSFARWVDRDLIASAEWLDQTSPGPLRDSALEAYVRTIAEERPDLAASRLADLPAGETRDHLTRQVHDGLSRLDHKAAADFARQHGLE